MPTIGSLRAPDLPRVMPGLKSGAGRLDVTTTVNLTGANGDETIRRISRDEAEKGTSMALKAYDRRFGARLQYEQTMNR